MRIAIIGGGLAGLTCAYKLRQRNIEAVVFDSHPQSAGRTAAASFLLGPEVFRRTFELIHAVGLASDVLAVRQVVGQLYRGRVYHHHVASAIGLLHFKGLNVIDKALLPKMALYLAHHGSNLDLHHPAKGLAYDDESVAEFTRREFSQNILNYVSGPLISTLFLYSSEETSKLLYLFLAKCMHSTGMYAVRGGLRRLAEKLSAGASIRDEHIGRVEQRAGAFIVGGETFTHIVIAASGDAVLQIDGIAELLDAEDRTFFTGCAYQRAVTVTVRTERPVDGRCYSLSIPRVENMAASTITFHDFVDPSIVSSGEGLLSVTGGGDSVTEEQLLADLRRIYHAEPKEWQTAIWESATPKFPPGRYREIEQFRSRQRHCGVRFCGDYLQGPYVEAAVSTGIEAAESL